MSPRPLQLIPDWHRAETLYSWSARMHRTLGGSIKDTGMLLFDAVHSYKEWAASARLDHLLQVTEGRLGDASDILLKRTVLAAYYPFLRPAQRQDFQARASSAQRTPWLTRFGMRASTLDRQEMRWCPCCVEADLQLFGMPTWQLPHQLPGAWWCVEHDTPLCTMVPTRAEWSLPEIGASAQTASYSAGEARVLRTLSALSASLVGREKMSLVMLKRALLYRLRDLGVVTSTKPVSPEDLQRWFAGTQLALAVYNASPAQHTVLARPWVHETLLQRRTGHPLLWMMLWTAGFEGLSEHEVVRSFHEPDETLIWQEDGQGMLWVEDRFHGDDRVQAAVANSMTVQEAARRLNVSVTTVRRYMQDAQCAPKTVLTTERRRARWEAAVSEIETLIRENPGLTRTEVLVLSKAAVSWLASWDKEKLASLLAVIPEVRQRQCGLGFE